MSIELTEITVGELRTADIGARVVITQEGVAFDGTLIGIDADRWPHVKEGLSIVVTLKVGVINPPASTYASETVSPTITITRVPIDYRLQIERQRWELGPTSVWSQAQWDRYKNLGPDTTGESA